MSLEQDQKIYLQVDNIDKDDEAIDLVNVFVNMGKRKKIYGYAFLIAICIGLIAGTGKILLDKMSVEKEYYAQAVITLQYTGIDEGLDPNGATLDINKLKSPDVIGDALDTIGETDYGVEDIRANISIEGVVPADAVERITVIQEMALTNVNNYEKILDVSYFPSQYIIKLNQPSGMTSDRTREILDAIIDSYRQYFFDTYANAETISVTSAIGSYDDYDYTEAIDIINTQLEIMQSYVSALQTNAPSFKASGTGLTFGDISTALDSVEQVDLSNLYSYIESNSLTKDRSTLVQYYTYKIKQYNRELSEARSNFETVQDTIEGYTKNQIVIVTGQDSTQQVSQSSEYYDSLVQQKIDISEQIASINTKLNETTELLEALENTEKANTQEQYDYANEKLESLTATIANWIDLIEQTTEEYYSTTLMANAVKVATPAQYVVNSNNISMRETVKTIGICVAVMVFIVFMVWCVDGLRIEIILMRNKNKKG